MTAAYLLVLGIPGPPGLHQAAVCCCQPFKLLLDTPALVHSAAQVYKAVSGTLVFRGWGKQLLCSRMMETDRDGS